MALLVGFWGIRRQGTLWGDEAVTYAMSHRSVPQLWHTLGHVDVVHGLYYLIMHGVFGLWDGGLVALRLPSVLAVAAATVGIVRLGQRLGGTWTGLLAGLVLPLLPPVQRYAQEGRSYALICALITWASCLLVSNLSRPKGPDGGRARGWVTYGVVMLTACLLHEVAVLILLAHGVTVFGTRSTRPMRRAWGITAAGVLAGLLPLAVFSTTQSAQVDWIGPPDAGEVLAFVVTALLGIVLARSTGRSRGPVTLPALALPLLILPTTLLILTSPLHPLYVDRYVLASAIAFALLAGAALDRLRLRLSAPEAGTMRRVTCAMALVAVLATLVPVSTALRKPGSRENDAVAIARAVQDITEPGDGLLFMPSRRRVWMLARPDSFVALSDLALERTPVASNTLFGRELPPERIRERILTSTRVIAVHDLEGQPLDANAREAVKRATLDAYFEECASRTVTQARITVYARPGHC
ncbi:hypothetical protein [Streptomyces sp. NPDC058092]|uniref:glycosyltransferase family 39 protein n=1 Tax=Streptomyces sp. NPDC058092 TaxID=3346336 RepID=UPI0036E3B5B2